MRALLIGALAGGCAFEGPPGIAETDAAPACETRGLAFGDICAFELPETSIDQPARIDTTTGAITGAGGASLDIACSDATLGGRDVCALWAASFELDAELRVFGDRPLVLIASGELRVRSDGAILAGSGDFGGVDAAGPGANPPDCAASGAGMAGGDFEDNDKTTSGGGGGGGFASRGGDGGTGRSGQASRGRAGDSMAAAPGALRGGCPGGDGGTSPESGAGGAGGGAVYLASLSARVRIDGRVDAAGGGGGGGSFIQGTSEGGGGGGGSGGMIVIDGELVLSGTITAGGGGGGEGSEADGPGQMGGDGFPGRDDNMPAQGGSGASSPDGGDGAAAQVEAGGGSSSDDGGGGGGGGRGFLVET